MSSPDRNGNHEQQKRLALLRIGEVLRLTGLSEGALRRAITRGDFPRPVKIGERSSAWPECEVLDWISGRIAARDRKGAA